METYHLDELSFRVPPGFQDQSLQVFVADRPHGRMSLTISREPRTDASVPEQAEALLSKLTGALRTVKVRARRTRQVSTLPGYEARLEARQDKASIYQRVAFVGWYDRMLVLTVTTLLASHKRGDELAERWLDSFRFRRRAP